MAHISPHRRGLEILNPQSGDVQAISKPLTSVLDHLRSTDAFSVCMSPLLTLTYSSLAIFLSTWSCCNPSCYVNYVSNWNLPLLPLSDVHFGFCLYTWRRYVNYRCYPPPSYRCWPFSVILFRHFSSPQRPNRPWSPSSPRYSLYNGYRRLNWQRYRSNHSFPNAEI